jgi:hypothetical protein
MVVRKKEDRNCLACNKLFYPSYNKKKYCSKNCARPSFGWSKGIIKTKFKMYCANCNKEFLTVPSDTNRKFCSNRCFGQSKSTSVILSCLYCKKDFIDTERKRRKKYCSHECFLAYSAKYRRSISKSKKTQKTNFLLKHNKCMVCFWNIEPAILELHHIDRNRNNNDIDNLLLLCPNCHSVDHFKNKDGQFGNNLGVGRPKKVKE